jgi:predicted nucleic acid-binding protein
MREVYRNVIVVDTNVVAYLWLPGDMTAAAEQVLRQDAEWAVPLVWRSEFRSILTGAVRHKALSLDRAKTMAAAAEDHLRNLEFAVDSGRVLELAGSSGCPAYDCEFVTLANDLGVRLITHDRAILKAFPTFAVPLEFAPRV